MTNCDIDSVDSGGPHAVMTPGYADALAATNSGGVLIDGAGGLNHIILGTCDSAVTSRGHLGSEHVSKTAQALRITSFR